MNIAFNRDTFYERIIAGDVVAVRLFLKAGVSPNSKKGNTWSPLMLASIYGHQSVAEVLLKNGADINMVSGNAGSLAVPAYYTALDFAENEGHINAI